MIVCVCNNINEAKLQTAKDEGFTNVHKAYEWLGGKVCCGSCCKTAKEFLTGETKDRIPRNPSVGREWVDGTVISAR